MNKTILEEFIEEYNKIFLRYNNLQPFQRDIIKVLCNVIEKRLKELEDKNASM